jgi:peptide/nickel transport system substrate-binding protein
LLAFVLALLLVAAACGSKKNNSNNANGGGTGSGGVDTTKPVMGGDLVYAQEAEDGAGVCLPEANLDISGINYARTIYDTLTAPDENGKFVPFLAAKVEKNADATVWTITLRDGVKFHDGTDLTATVVKNNLDAYRGAYPARNPFLYKLVFGPYIKSVDAPDAKTVVVTTNSPWPLFDSQLWSQGRLGMMAQKQLDEGAECAKDLIGTGPFMLKEWVIGDHFTAVRNPNYWEKDKDGNQLPYLNSITFKPVIDGQQRINGLQSGQFQMIHTSSALDAEQLRVLGQQGKIIDTESARFGEVNHYMLNETKPPFNNIHARKAFVLALDVKTLIHVRRHDVTKPANGPYAPEALGFIEDNGYPQFNLDEAKKEVQAFKDETGQDLTFTLGDTPSPESVETSNFVKGMLEAAGMHVTTYTVEQSQYILKAISRDFEAYAWRNFGRLGGDTLYFWWHCNNAPPADCDNPINFGGFNDAQINSDLDKGRGEADPDKQKALYQDVSKVFATQLYNAWTDQTLWTVGSSTKVHGVFGPDFPDGGKPNPGLADGHPMSGLFITP